MKTTHLSKALLVAAIGSVALIGCKKKEEAVVVPPTAPAPTTIPEPVLPVAAPVTVSLGNAIGADNRITTPQTAFAPADTIHASVATDGAAATTLAAKWTHVDSNQVVHEESKSVAAGPQVTEFRISKPDGWPTGGYRLEVSQDGSVVQTTDFTVQ